MTSFFDGGGDPTPSPAPDTSGLISPEYLQTTLADQSEFDPGLATWAIEVVSNTARMVARRTTWTEATVPPAVRSIVSLAARRLYTNPDRFTRENAGDYGYALDASVTHADVFTPHELGVLKQHAPQAASGGLRTISTTRGDVDYPDGYGRTGYVPDGNPHYHGFPWYGGEGAL